jgi:hypothetical protein
VHLNSVLCAGYNIPIASMFIVEKLFPKVMQTNVIKIKEDQKLLLTLSVKIEQRDNFNNNFHSTQCG